MMYQYKTESPLAFKSKISVRDAHFHKTSCVIKRNFITCMLPSFFPSFLASFPLA